MPPTPTVEPRVSTYALETVATPMPIQNSSTSPKNTDLLTADATGNTWYVAPTGSDANLCTDPTAPCATINGAIGKALSGDIIKVAVGLYKDLIIAYGSDQVVWINKDIMLSGGWNDGFTEQIGTSTIDGEGIRQGIRVFTGSGSLNATIERFTIKNGYSNIEGGGIANYQTLTIIQSNLMGNKIGDPCCTGGSGGAGISNYGTMFLKDSTVAHNTIVGGFFGSAIWNDGSITIENSTISNNSGDDAIYNSSRGLLTFNNSTITNNTGGIKNLYSWTIGNITVGNSILATNGKDCTGPFTSLGHNLIGNNQGCTFNATTGDLVGTNENPIDPRLSPLQDYGGWTLTHALRTGSLAIDAGNPAVPGSGGNACPSTDQRGITRPQGSHCDIGAYEAEAGGTLPATPSFADVPMTHPYWQEIEILYANGLTGGCGTAPLRFCPDKTMNRGEAAVFILRGTFGSGFLPAPATHIFKDDWRKGRWAEPWAEAMQNTGLSAGCLTSPLKYCPWNQIPREQAVIFALRLRYGVGYQPPAATGTVFADMTNPNHFATAWAEQAYKDGLIQQCGVSGGRPKFCPKNIVSRGLAAQLIVRAKNLTMP